MADRSSWRSLVFGAFAAVVLSGLLGNAAQSQSTAYTYDGLGRLSSASYSDGKTITYTYDAAGNRTQRVVSGEDLTPNAFDLGPAVSNATAGARYTSASPALSGFNSPLSTSVTGGEYRIDGGAWQNTTSTVRPGQTVQVRVQAPPSPGSTQTATLTVGSVSDTFQVTTAAASDTTPDPFDLGGPVTGATGGSWVASNAPSIAGINAPAAVSVSGGQYRINGGAWQTAANTVTVGQTVQVQVLAPAAGGASQTATLTIGGVSDTFQVTTGADTTPDPFDLGGPITGLASGAWASSNSPTITGINAAASVSITGGQYRINGGAWQTGAGSITAGQTVQVQAQAPAAGGASQTATLTIGGVSDAFQVTTAVDTTPDPFDLGGPITGLASGAWASSNSPTITGINAAASVSITGGQYRINGGAWQTGAGSIAAGQTVQDQAQAPAAGGASQTATLTIGGVSDAFQVTTVVDATPDPFNLGGPVTGAVAGSWVASNAPTITGINTSAPVSISGGQYRINGGAWQTGAGSVTAGQTVQVQAQAPAGSGDSQTATLTVGGVSASFTVTTQDAPDYTPDPLNWNDLSISFRGRPNGQPVPPKFVDGATLTISGLSPGLSITLSFGQDTVSPGASGLIVIVYKNGVPLNPLSLSVADGSNVSRGPAGLTVSVANGDTIRFQAEVFDSAILRNSGNASNRSARQLVYNQTTSSLIDTFDIYGSYEEPTYCGQQEC